MSKFLKVTCLILVLGIFSSYKPNFDINKKSLFFPINKILIKKNDIIETKLILKNLENIRGTSLFSLDESSLKKLTKNLQFLSSLSVKKIYPNTLQITIYEKEPKAILQRGIKKFYIFENGEIIDFLPLKKLNDLPIVIGNAKNFEKLYLSLKKTNFPVKEIQRYFYYEIGRWDILLKNEKIIKLPKKNNEISLVNFLNIYNDTSFKKYKIFDYRINNQLILN